MTRLQYLVVCHGMLVLLIGLGSGVMLIFAMLEAVTIWPLPAWEARVPGSVRGWSAAHVGGILNGVMIAGAAVLMKHLATTGRTEQWIGWSMIITGWCNTVFYWAGNLAANRGLSVAATPYGEGDFWGALAFLGGGVGMFFTVAAVIMLAKVAWQRAGEAAS